MLARTAAIGQGRFLYIFMDFLIQWNVKPVAIVKPGTLFSHELILTKASSVASIACQGVWWLFCTILMDTPKHPNHGYFLIYIAAHM